MIIIIGFQIVKSPDLTALRTILNSRYCEIEPTLGQQHKVGKTYSILTFLDPMMTSNHPYLRKNLPVH
jgi:hypothetical protein